MASGTVEEFVLEWLPWEKGATAVCGVERECDVERVCGVESVFGVERVWCGESERVCGVERTDSAPQPSSTLNPKP